MRPRPFPAGPPPGWRRGCSSVSAGRGQRRAPPGARDGGAELVKGPSERNGLAGRERRRAPLGGPGARRLPRGGLRERPAEARTRTRVAVPAPAHTGSAEVPVAAGPVPRPVVYVASGTFSGRAPCLLQERTWRDQPLPSGARTPVNGCPGWPGSGGRAWLGRYACSATWGPVGPRTAAPACWASIAAALEAICGTFNSRFLHVVTDFDFLYQAGKASASFRGHSPPCSSYHYLLCSGEQEGLLLQFPSPRLAVAPTSCVPVACDGACHDLAATVSLSVSVFVPVEVGM